MPESSRFRSAPSADFDFLIGSWDATIALPGREPLVGRWDARHLLDRQIVLDHLQVANRAGRPVSCVATLRTWIPSDRCWTATFLYAQAPRQHVELRGSRLGDEIHLTAHDLKSGAAAAIRFFDITATTFRWEQRNHADDDADGPAIAIRCTRRANGH